MPQSSRPSSPHFPLLFSHVGIDDVSTGLIGMVAAASPAAEPLDLLLLPSPASRGKAAILDIIL